MWAIRRQRSHPPVRWFAKSGGGSTLGRGFGRSWSQQWWPTGKRLRQPWSHVAQHLLVYGMLTTTWEDWGVITRLHDPNDYSGTAAQYFEAILKTADVSIAARARLYNITTSTPVAQSKVATVSTTAVRLRSPGFTLPEGDHEYKAQIGEPA